jgi:5-aminolevulinate synthase
MNYQRFFQEAIDQLHAERRYRVFADLERRSPGSFPRAIWRSGGETRGNHRLVLERLSRHGPASGRDRSDAERADRMGAGAGGTRNISGTNHPLVELEASSPTCTARRPASSSPPVSSPTRRRSRPSPACLPDCLILSDELNHASMIEGVRGSGCREEGLPSQRRAPSGSSCCVRPGASAPKLIVFESVYSMDGDVAPIAEIADLAERYGAMTYIDEVHAVGMYGPAAAASPSARGSCRPDRRDRGHAGQGVRRAGRLHHRHGS